MERTIEFYIANPEELLNKKPFIRGGQFKGNDNLGVAALTNIIRARLPKLEGNVISQEVYLQEYNPDMHSIKYNKSIPDFKVAINNGNNITEVNIVVTSARQKNIHAKQCLHLCGNETEFKMVNSINPNKKEAQNFVRFKQEWITRNMKQYRDKAVSIQKKTGDCGVLFTLSKYNKLKVRTLSFADGYVIIPNYDDFGDLIACTLYYSVNNDEYIKMYTDTKVYTWVKKSIENGATPQNNEFELIDTATHGFTRIPLIYKRGYVAWEFAQSAIEMREVIMAIDSVVKKRFGWHWLWLNADMDNITIDSGEGMVIISNPDVGNDKADAKTIEFPEATGIEKMLETLDDEIQIASSTTQILPKYIKAGNDVSGTAVKVTMSMDYELATQTANDWQEFLDQFVFLFAEGLGLEEGLINKYTDLKVKGVFKIWMPESETAYNQMVGQMYQMGVISQETAIEKNTLSSPDEKERVASETQKKLEQEQKKNDSSNNDTPQDKRQDTPQVNK